MNNDVILFSLNRNVETLAGKLIYDNYAEPGCPQPCLKGVKGYNDSTLQNSTFSFPTAITVGNGYLLVTDNHRVRRISYANNKNTVGGIYLQNRVVTISGGNINGERDGNGAEAMLNRPRGIEIDSSGRIYVADSVPCQIKQITNSLQFAQNLTCSSTLFQVNY